MDLMTLVGRITLDLSEFESGLSEAESKAENLQLKDPSLSLNTDDYKKGVEELEAENKKLDGSMKELLGGLAEGLTKAGITAAITGLTTLLANSVNYATKLGDQIDKGSKRLNISTDAYQKWNYALQQSGSNITDLQHGISTINQVLTGSKVSEKTAKAFETLGVSAQDASGQMKTTEQFLTETISALADFQGSREQRGALAQAIFGNAAGSKLSALFDEGSSGIKNLIKEAEQLGNVMTEEEIANAVDFGDSISRMQEAINGLQSSLGSTLIPMLTEAVNMVTQIVTFFHGGIGGNTISDDMAEIDKSAASATDSIEHTENAAMAMADKLIMMGDALKLSPEEQQVWADIAGSLISMVPSLQGLIDIDSMQITGSTQAIRDNIQAWAELARTQALYQARAEKQKALVDSNKEALNAQAEIIRKEADVEAYRVDAINEFNQVLEKYGMGDRKLSQDATGAEIHAARQEIGFTKNTYGIQTELGAAEERYTKPLSTLQDLQREYAIYLEQLAQAQEDYNAWEAALSNVFGSTSESGEAATGAVEAVGEAIDNLPDHKEITIDVTTNYPDLGGLMDDGKPHAKGAWDIPYDDYPALLHRGEMVLTASQARKYRNGQADSSINYDTLTSSIISAIRSGMAGATVRSYLSGKDITSTVNKRTSNQLKAKRYAT